MVAHRIFEAAYFIMRAKVAYRELGDQYLDAHHREHIIRHHVRRLESVGLHIDIRELPLTGESLWGDFQRSCHVPWDTTTHENGLPLPCHQAV